jgi:hypothetical protein
LEVMWWVRELTGVHGIIGGSKGDKKLFGLLNKFGPIVGLDLFSIKLSANKLGLVCMVKDRASAIMKKRDEMCTNNL